MQADGCMYVNMCDRTYISFSELSFQALHGRFGPCSPSSQSRLLWGGVRIKQPNVSVLEVTSIIRCAVEQEADCSHTKSFPPFTSSDKLISPLLNNMWFWEWNRNFNSNLLLEMEFGFTLFPVKIATRLVGDDEG